VYSGREVEDSGPVETVHRNPSRDLHLSKASESQCVESDGKSYPCRGSPRSSDIATDEFSSSAVETLLNCRSISLRTPGTANDIEDRKHGSSNRNPAAFGEPPEAILIQPANGGCTERFTKELFLQCSQRVADHFSHH
jgi:hypothetical protein